MRLTALLLPALLTTLSLPLFAQGDTVTRNPAAVQLKRIWKLEGNVPGALLGAGVGSVGDINGDGVGDFAVSRDLPAMWMVFYGSRDSIASQPVWTMDTGNYALAPVVGDFWGTGHKAVGFQKTTVNRQTLRLYDWIRIYRTDSNRLEQTPSAVWYAVSFRDTTQRAVVSDALACDLDGDGDDELVVAIRHEYGQGAYGQLWIYDGGPDFQVDTPSVVLRDPEVNYYYRAYAEDINGDQHIDLMTVTQTQQQEGNSYCFYWGTGQLPPDNKQPDRQLISPEFSKFLAWVDCDGDNFQDLITDGILIWRSASGKDPRTRPWNRADADIYLKSAGGQLNSGQQPGYLNSKRYEMVSGLWAPGQILFSGSPTGPDLVYDATYYPGADGLQALIPIRGPVGDINGDGWDDAIGGNRAYPDDRTSAGIAVILAGGPYIPSDDPAVSVRQIPLENRAHALSLWPNPVRDELNLAWRGDLVRMPRRFVIHDMLGQVVASGAVPDGDGAAVWRAAGVPAGAYLVSVFDAAGTLLATTRFLKL
jgi:hypothetical protein